MTFIETVPEEQASGEVATHYAQARGSFGYVPNMFKAFSLRPAAMQAWSTLLSGIREQMDPRRYELVTLAAARALNSSYCMLAHGSVLLKDTYDTQQLRLIAEDFRSAGLDAADVAMMGFAEKVVRNAAAITREDVEDLRRHGFDDREIFDLAAAAAARCFFSKLLDALGTRPDAAYTDLDAQLRDALVVGRPIDGAAAS